MCNERRHKQQSDFIKPKNKYQNINKFDAIIIDLILKYISRKRSNEYLDFSIFFFCRNNNMFDSINFLNPR